MTAFFSKRYKLLGPIGKGGMSIVYKARDKMLNMTVAIKFLPEKLLHDSSALERLKREAALAMRLSQEHIVKLHNIEGDRGRLFLVMEYVEGTNFREILREEGVLPTLTVLQVAYSCALALDYAHERGVLHLDLKPENLMLNKDSVLKIVDFGTARYVGGLYTDDEGYLEGSPAYMSPEQISGAPIDLRADVYSLGVIVYELLCGRPPFPIDSKLETFLRSDPPPLDGFPDQIASVVDKAIRRDREQRWNSAGEFYSELYDAARASGLVTE